MKFTIATIAAVAGFLGMASAAPMEKRAVTDTDILQYALTLEHLEANFYKTYLDKYSQADFAAAGQPDWVRNRLVNIQEHEAQHVSLLSGALGAAATQPCTYKFPVTDVNSFLAVASILESVGVSAYLGAAQSISTPAYITVAGSILTTESRHQGWLSSSVLRGPGWSTPEDTPLSFSPVYTLASQFITSCPSTNPALPFTAFPALTYDATSGAVSAAALKDGQYIAVYQGLSVGTYPVKNGKVALPQIYGFAYIVATSESDATKVGDANILAGPVILDNPYNSKLVPSPGAPVFTSASS